MLAFIFVVLSFVICSPALAAAVSTAPELDPGSLAALTAGLTGAYFIYRVYRSRNKR
ncbi:MAG TPA: hypothetical protein V6C69_06695 [Trichormus sp.]|jgi:hypothetical protein